MKYVILSPYGVRTGGPEACCQLSDALIRCGVDAEMWLVSEADVSVLRDAVRKRLGLVGNSWQVPVRTNSVAEYEQYRSKPFRAYAPGDDVMFIVPEVYVWIVPLLMGAKVLVWWLSVDNAFRALSDINLNLLRAPLIRHAVQSEYARAFTASLGLRSTFLTDYTVVPAKPALPLTERPLKVSVNAGQKVVCDLKLLGKLLAELCPSIEIAHIKGLSREQVYDAFSTSRVFIDLGSFPGRDRMAREALLLGTNIVVGNAGAGSYEADYPLPETYRPPVHDMETVASVAAHMALDPAAHAMQFHVARQMISCEKQKFDEEVRQTFC